MMISGSRTLSALELLVWECRELPGNPDAELVKAWAEGLLERRVIEEEEVDRIVDYLLGDNTQ